MECGAGRMLGKGGWLRRGGGSDEVGRSSSFESHRGGRARSERLGIVQLLSGCLPLFVEARTISLAR